MFARVHYIILLLFVASIVAVSCQEKRADRFEREAREYTATNCPVKYPDGVTVLDSMVYEQGGESGTLKLYYSLLLTDEQRELLLSKLDDISDENLSVVRNSLQLAHYKSAGVTFCYIYRDAQRGDKIAELKYTKEDYN